MIESPTRVTTGTPIHNASQVVTPPVNGKGSRATSISPYSANIELWEDAPRGSNRSGSTPYAAKRLRIIFATAGSCIDHHFSLRREPGCSTNISAQRAITAESIFGG